MEIKNYSHALNKYLKILSRMDSRTRLIPLSMENNLLKAIVELDEERALEIARKELENSKSPFKMLEVLRKAADIIGEKYSKGEFFVADLVMAGEILKEISEMIRPLLQSEPRHEYVGRLIIGTVQGDIHDIGKNIVVSMAEAAGFEVIDLGVDVPPEKFVEAIKTYKPDIVGLSGLLTLSIESMKRTVDVIKNTGLRDQVKIIIGGGRVDESACKYVGADAWTTDAGRGIKIMLEWVKEKKR